MSPVGADDDVRPIWSAAAPFSIRSACRVSDGLLGRVERRWLRRGDTFGGGSEEDR